MKPAMTPMRRCLLLLATSLALWTGQPANARDLNAAEQLFAHLTQMSPDERHIKIIEGATKEGKLRFVHSLRGDLGRDHAALFLKRYPFMTVEQSELGSQDAAERLVTEEAAGRHITDAVVAETPDLTELLRRDIAAHYSSPEIGRVLRQYKSLIDRENRWVPFAVDEHGITYNTDLVARPPKTYEELCDPRFRRTTSFEPFETRFLEGMFAIFDNSFKKLDDWVGCIARNQPILQRGHTQRQRLMLAGDHAISPDQYIYDGIAQKRKFPALPFGADFDAPVTITALDLVINRNTPYPYAAALFADWLMSEESQAYLASRLRGPIALKHPYFTDDTKLVSYGYAPAEVIDRLNGIWNRHLGRR
ncbi:MAG TPA: extracellular solute-binding protein [Xanthobacteraceae bacterium]|jgi:ABC-type Fe3+ transport system substrate-binding protein